MKIMVLAIRYWLTLTESGDRNNEYPNTQYLITQPPNL